MSDLAILLHAAVQETEGHVARQQRLVDRLEHAGRDATLARRLLASFETTLAVFRRHLARCEVGLVDGKPALPLLRKEPYLQLIWSREEPISCGGGASATSRRRKR